MRTSIMLTSVAILMLGLYVLPGVTARLAGSHTWEANLTGGPSVLQCGKCHVYIVNEFNATTTNLTNVVDAHMAYSATSQYVNSSGGWINVSTPTGTLNDMCAMCHVVEAPGYQGHTKVTIRACTDGDCHGLTEAYNGSAYSQENKTAYFGQKLNITEKLRLPVDAHSKFFNPMNTQESQYRAEGDGDTNGTLLSNGNYTQGFYTCMACHTHIGVQMDVYRPNTINFSIDNSADGFSFVVSAIGINSSSINSTTSYGTFGSKWK